MNCNFFFSFPDAGSGSGDGGRDCSFSVFGDFGELLWMPINASFKQKSKRNLSFGFLRKEKYMKTCSLSLVAVYSMLVLWTVPEPHPPHFIFLLQVLT